MGTLTRGPQGSQPLCQVGHSKETTCASYFYGAIGNQMFHL